MGDLKHKEFTVDCKCQFSLYKITITNTYNIQYVQSNKDPYLLCSCQELDENIDTDIPVHEV